MKVVTRARLLSVLLQECQLNYAAFFFLINITYLFLTFDLYTLWINANHIAKNVTNSFE